MERFRLDAWKRAEAAESSTRLGHSVSAPKKDEPVVGLVMLGDAGYSGGQVYRDRREGWPSAGGARRRGSYCSERRASVCRMESSGAGRCSGWLLRGEGGCWAQRRGRGAGEREPGLEPPRSGALSEEQHKGPSQWPSHQGRGWRGAGVGCGRVTVHVRDLAEFAAGKSEDTLGRGVDAQELRAEQCDSDWLRPGPPLGSLAKRGWNCCYFYVVSWPPRGSDIMRCHLS